MSQAPPKKPDDTLRSRTTPELSLVEDPIPDLKLEDTAAQQRRGLGVKGGVTGYNPYDTGQTVEPRVNSAPKSAPPPSPSHKPTDLRKLSEWIKAQRRAEAVRAEEQAGGEAAAQPEPPVTAPGVRNPRR
jgi:hypothetical protein